MAVSVMAVFHGAGHEDPYRLFRVGKPECESGQLQLRENERMLNLQDMM